MCQLTWLKHQLDFCDKMIGVLESRESSEENKRYLVLYNKQKDIINYYIEQEKLKIGQGSERKLKTQWYAVNWLKSNKDGGE